MKYFITGTDTNIGKTLISSWLCLHTGYDYFKPIQTGIVESIDSVTVSQLSKAKTHKEYYMFANPLSPHMAAEDEGKNIDINEIKLPDKDNLIIEGVGGLLVPLNDKHMIIDLIYYLQTPVILVASSKLGTINHTLLSLQILRQKNIKIAGVILSGKINNRNSNSIMQYGNIEILAQLPYIEKPSFNRLSNFALTPELKKLF